MWRMSPQLAAAGVTRLFDRMSRRRRFAYAFLALVGVYLANGRVAGEVDCLPAALLPIAVLVDGSLTYDGIIAGLERGPVPAGFSQSPHGLVSVFPVATGLLAIPFYAPAVIAKALLSSPTLPGWVNFAWRYQKVPAAIVGALTVLIFWRLCEDNDMPAHLALGLTLWLAFGSELYSTGAQALWQHGPGTLAVVGAMQAQARLRRRATAGVALTLSFFCGLAIVVRPTNALVVGPFGLLGLKESPRHWLSLLLPGAVLVALQLAYNLHFYAAVLGNYAWAPSQLAFANLAEGLLGLLVSPGRGLLVYFSVAGLASAALILRPRTLLHPAAGAACLAIVASTTFAASYHQWWGGWSYGPRFLSEIEPAILLLLGLAWMGLSPRAQRGLLVLLFALLPFGILVQAVGAYDNSATTWTSIPVNVDDAPWRFWDVADNPISRGLGLSRPAN